MNRKSYFKFFCLIVLLLPSIALSAQDVVIRRNTTTTTTSTSTTTVSRKPQDHVVKPPKPKVTTGTLSVPAAPATSSSSGWLGRIIKKWLN